MSPDRKPSVQPFSQAMIEIDKKREAVYRSIALRGRDELVLLSKEFPQKGSLFPGTPEFEALHDERKKKAKRDLNSMLFGPLNQAIDIALSQGIFDPIQFYARYKSLAKNTSAPNNPGVNPDDRPATPEEIERMRTFAKGDVDHSRFFTWQGIHMLPSVLTRILLKNKNYKVIRDEIMPGYKADLAEQGIGMSERARAERRFSDAKNKGVELHTDEKLVRLTRRKTKKEKPEKTQQTQIYEPFLPVFDQLLVDYENAERERYKNSGIRRKELAEKYYGPLPDPDKIQMSPSIAAQCLRKVGYYYMGKVIPAPSTPESVLAKAIGTGLHYQLRVISYQLDKTIMLSEMSVPPIPNENDEFRGKMDLLHRNPRTKITDVIDHKSVHPFVFSKLSKDGLPDYLKGTKFYAPSHENEIQILSYIYDMDKNFPWLNIQSGRIVYIDVETKARKEGIVVWDALAKWKFEQFLETKRKAEQKILRGELPDEPDELPSESFECARCEFLTDCLPGQRIAAEKIKRRVQGRAPRSVYIMARQEREERSRIMADLNITQEGLPTLDLSPVKSS